MKTINTQRAPQAIGPYGQAILVDNNTLYCSGQIGINPQTGEMQQGIEAQIKQTMENIREVLQAANCTFENVSKTTIFITDMKNFMKVNEVYGSFFSDHKPARSTVGVASLPKGALVEIEVIAVK